ncbi:hypothetical protein BO71DRAFT_339403 [Aspergillus ellipticus CBS 707.79]|uniref:Zn(2)-C6 fungal-type domain-containing protein n=1 Tax=Aspergillus ellipticus CBS 707.79 TaxID=1448320 RepID=A0A319DJE6_9EURO|nr:hypothetical protein BO71DRAFT_339403 [Aspergillus ellipticus CBS 707.79]
MLSAGNPNPEASPPSKRRKIRKGTSSCWECKRRKVRCVFANNSDATCVGCQRRGIKCLSQEFPDEAGSGQPISDRVGRVEALVDQLVRNAPAHVAESRASSPSPIDASSVGLSDSAHDAEPEQLLAQDADHASAAARYAKVSQALYASLPSRKDIDILWKARAHVSIGFHRVMITAYPDLERDGLESPETLMDIPGPEAHPVWLARYMFLVSKALRYLDLPQSEEQINALSEPPRMMMKRLAETAIRLVTTHDELLGTVEGLECVMMDGIYQADIGNLRPAWIAFRRAMALAQMMGIHRPGRHSSLRLLNPQHKFNAPFLWYRIVYTDRFLCLMLGLPQGSLDRSMAAEAALAQDTPLGRLERLHCAIASRILERNDADPTSYTIVTAREIDLELQNAAQAMPSGWWLPPSLTRTGASAQQFWEMLRLVTQLYHFNLLNQLHLPFMLHFTSATPLHNYCQSTCVNASREILSRFIAFRTFNRVAYCCRAVDFFALIAALVLLIAHLRMHARPADDLNPLAHQRPGDRAMVEHAVASMDELGRVSQDVLSAKSADLLRRLLGIEEEAAKGRVYRMQSVRAADEPAAGTGPTESVLRIRIPYFGTVKIAPEGGVSKETPPTGENLALDDSGIAPMQPSALAEAYVPQMPEAFGGLYPGLTAGAEDWAFQGVDMAFFENLIQGSILGAVD